MTHSDSDSMVKTEVPATLGLQSVRRLDETHRTRLSAIVDAELSRYPGPLASALPDLYLVDSAERNGRPVRATFIADANSAVLTPRFDLRGNVHRVVAMSLLHKFPNEARGLQHLADSEPESLCLYGHGLTRTGHLAALIGAVMSGRQSVRTAIGGLTQLKRAIDEAISFLVQVGVSRVHIDALQPPPAAGYLSDITGEYPAFGLKSTPVEVALIPPSPDEFAGYEFGAIGRERSDSMCRSLLLDIWPLPEGLLTDCVKAIHVVESVSQATQDIAGFASGHSGGTSRIILEREGRRRILYHELGHAIHHRFEAVFPADDWRALVPKDGYFGDARAFIRSGIRQNDYSPDLLERGFITSYGSSTLQEDIAEICEALFSGDSRLWASLPGSSLLDGKVELLLRFLSSVNPVFTRDYFERLCSERPRFEAAWVAK